MALSSVAGGDFAGYWTVDGHLLTISTTGFENPGMDIFLHATNGDASNKIQRRFTSATDFTLAFADETWECLR